MFMKKESAFYSDSYRLIAQYLPDGHRMMVQYLRDVNNHIRIVRRLGLPDRESVAKTYEEHHEICQRILANDVEGATVMLRAHIHESQAKSREVTLAQLEMRRRERAIESASGHG